MKTIVLYHASDYDGIFCREIARKFLPEAELMGWDFGQPSVKPTADFDEVYVLDLPCDKPLGIEASRLSGGTNLVWIDHHKSSIESHPKDIPGYRIDGVAACRLAWQWFVHARHSGDGRGLTIELPIKSYYQDRLVDEPLAVRLAGEYDVWDHRGDGDLEFQFGLDMRDRPSSEFGLNWTKLLSVDDHAALYVEETVRFGELGMGLYAKRDADIMRSRSFLNEWEGLKFLCLNTARCNSNTFAALDVPETGHDALMGFYFNGRMWTFSLYHAKHRTDLDLSTIAVKYGGGGHRGACGFRLESIHSVFA